LPKSYLFCGRRPSSRHSIFCRSRDHQGHLVVAQFAVLITVETLERAAWIGRKIRADRDDLAGFEFAVFVGVVVGHEPGLWPLGFFGDGCGRRDEAGKYEAGGEKE
jgi:hypothetical protein